MSKGKATVTLPDGTQETRRTDRAYQFAIVTRHELDREERRTAERNLAEAREHLAEYEAVVASGVVPADFRGTLNVADYREFVPAERDRVARYEARLAQPVTGALSDYGVRSYHGSLALAQKAKDALLSSGYEFFETIEIVPVDFTPGTK